MQNRGQQNSRNVATLEPQQRCSRNALHNERQNPSRFCPYISHCETAARKIAETLPLEPTKKKQKDGKPASNQAKPKKKVFGERMRKSRTPAGFVPKPCKTVARKTLETSPTKRTILKNSKTSKTSPTERQNPRSLGSACEKAEPQQVSCLNHAKP